MTDTAICALMPTDPFQGMGRKIGIATLTGVDVDGIRRAETLPVYEHGGTPPSRYSYRYVSTTKITITSKVVLA